MKGFAWVLVPVLALAICLLAVAPAHATGCNQAIVQRVVAQPFVVQSFLAPQAVILPQVVSFPAVQQRVVVQRQIVRQKAPVVQRSLQIQRSRLIRGNSLSIQRFRF